MEFSPAQRKIIFALVVFALAGLGFYLVTSRQDHRQAAAPTQHSTAPAVATGASSPPPSASPSASSASASSPTSASPDPGIYQWLPFTKSDLASAAADVVKFGDAYGTFSYTQSAARYVATLQGLATSGVTEQIAAAYSTPGVAHLRASQKQVSAGSARISSLRAFGPSSLTFVVSVTEHITATTNSGPVTASYAITVTGGGSNWQVSSIELAQAGNS